MPLPAVWLKPAYVGDAVMALALLDGLAQRGRPRVFVGPVHRQLYATRERQLEMLTHRRPRVGEPSCAPLVTCGKSAQSRCYW